MKNWSTDIKKVKKNDKSFIIWRLEQLINFGLDDERLNLADMEKYWDELIIDPFKKRFLSLLLDK